MEITNNKIIIDKEKIFKNETVVFINSNIEIYDLLCIKRGQLLVKDCVINFLNSDASIVGVETEFMKFENCVFISDCKDDKNCMKIVSYIDESYSTYNDVQARYCSVELFNKIEFSKCKFIRFCDVELINAAITHSLFKECYMGINSLFISDCLFEGGQTFLFINERGIVEHCVFEKVFFSEGYYTSISLVEVDEKAKVRNCIFKEVNILDKKMYVIGTSSSDNFSVRNCKFINCNSTLFECKNAVDNKFYEG